MAKTIYKKRIINGRNYFYYRLRHKNLRKSKDVYASTVKELEGKIRNITRDLENNIKDTKEYFDTFFTEWFFNVKFLKIKPSTQTLYESIYRTYIKECELSDVKIKDICASDLQRYYKNLFKKGITPHTIKSIHKLIAPCIRYAYNNDIILKDFIGAIELPKENEKSKLEKESRVQPFTVEEQKKFIEGIKDNKYRILFLTALYSGLRQGELLALTWNDINFDECYIDVNKTMSEVADVSEEGRGKIKQVIQTPKTKNSIRKVDVPVSLVKLLNGYKTKQAESALKNNARYQDNNLVFCNKYGKFLNPRRLRKTFKDILIDKDIKDRKFHDLRHTYATRLFELGENPKTVQKLLGHGKITVTMDTYTHVLDNIKEKAATKLNTLFDEFGAE
ncbi:site-specific integrase [Clostridium botulinum]|uniref:Site-specific integrase n=1 Tax=Clostridium botulinum TaxID=1491 RepID=A0A6M0SP26_CLOBO|nr:site-specific integrase [Clostridium botulinum]